MAFESFSALLISGNNVRDCVTVGVYQYVHVGIGHDMYLISGSARPLGDVEVQFFKKGSLETSP